MTADTVTAPRTPQPRGRARFEAWWYRLRTSWRVFTGNRLALAGLAILLLFALLPLIHTLLFELRIWRADLYDPITGGDFEVFPRPSGPVPGHPLGVDTLGRDNLSRLMASTASSFKLAIAAALTTALVSTAIGALSAYFRRWVDFIFMHLADALLLFPAPVLMIILGYQLSEEMTEIHFGVLYGLLVGAGSAAVVMRAQALSLMARPFIEAARVAGGDGAYIIGRHLVPHMLPLAAAHMMQAVVGAVVADGFIAFFGFRESRLNWGQMTYEGFTWMRTIPGDVPWVPIFAPAVALSLFAAAFYFISRGLHDVADPRLRGEHGSLIREEEQEMLRASTAEVAATGD